MMFGLAMVALPMSALADVCCSNTTGACTVLSSGSCAAGAVQVVSTSSCTPSPCQPCALAFGAPTNFAAGSTPSSVAIADVNGDGRPDLVVANFGSNNVSVLLGNGNGTFGAATNPAVGVSPASVAIGDVNGDGRPDLVVASSGGDSVSVLLGNGNGTFGAATNFTVNSSPTSVAIGDVNGDGIPDLVVSNCGGNNVTVLLGAGNGTFTISATLLVGACPEGIALADVNGDGTLDIVTANQSNNVSVLLGNGMGGFAAAAGSPFVAGNFPLSVAVGDVNGDGKPDIVVANFSGGNVSALLGTGTGTFAAPTNFAAGVNPYFVAIADLNGDGKPDIVVANYGGSIVSVLLGLGGTGGTGANMFAPATSIGSSAGVHFDSVAVGDFNGDGRPDLAVASSSGVSVLLSTAQSIGISPQPLGQSIRPGSTATFIAGATGVGPFTYQWRRNGAPIVGATGTTLAVPNASASSAGAYDVQVRGGCNPFAVVTSNPAMLTVGILGDACPADFNNSGALEVADIFAFLNAWFAGCP